MQVSHLCFQKCTPGSHWLSSRAGNLKPQAHLPSAQWAKYYQRPGEQERHAEPWGGCPGTVKGMDCLEEEPHVIHQVLWLLLNKGELWSLWGKLMMLVAVCSHI